MLAGSALSHQDDRIKYKLDVLTILGVRAESLQGGHQIDKVGPPELD